jgi:sugar fermentation stimulation protein A
MKFTDALIKGKLLKRYKRFLADVELDNGDIVVAHCPNTGAMTGCAEPGFQVWLSRSTNPKRKLGFTWELARTFENEWIGINTNRANALVAEALARSAIPELSSYMKVNSEVKYGRENSRIDFLISEHAGELSGQDCYLEVKSVTLMRLNKGYFPDAASLRGQKHLRELTSMVELGHRAVLLYCVQHSGISDVSVAEDIDPNYAVELKRAILAGVEVLCYSTKIDEEKIIINQRLPFLA